MVQAPDFSDHGEDGADPPVRRGALLRLGAAGSARKAASAGTRKPPRLSGRDNYSLFVGILKVVLPAFAVALVLLVVAWPQLIPDDSRFRIAVTQISLDQAENLSMMNARYDGIDEQNRPFSVTADLATQDSADADIVDLELPKADITLEDGTWLAITAKTGRYRREAEIVELAGEVVLFHDEGFEVRTDAATVYLSEGDAEGILPVQGQGPAGELNAEGFQLINQGERIIFTGRSRLLLQPEADEELQQ